MIASQLREFQELFDGTTSSAWVSIEIEVCLACGCAVELISSHVQYLRKVLRILRFSVQGIGIGESGVQQEYEMWNANVTAHCSSILYSTYSFVDTLGNDRVGKICPGCGWIFF